MSTFIEEMNLVVNEVNINKMELQQKQLEIWSKVKSVVLETICSKLLVEEVVNRNRVYLAMQKMTNEMYVDLKDQIIKNSKQGLKELIYTCPYANDISENSRTCEYSLIELNNALYKYNKFMNGITPLYIYNSDTTTVHYEFATINYNLIKSIASDINEDQIFELSEIDTDFIKEYLSNICMISVLNQDIIYVDRTKIEQYDNNDLYKSLYNTLRLWFTEITNPDSSHVLLGNKHLKGLNFQKGKGLIYQSCGFGKPCEYTVSMHLSW